MKSGFAAAVAPILIFALVGLTGCGKAPEVNLLIMTIDTLRADHLSCYGYPKATSPRMDRFASDGVLFEHVVCQSSQTLPSHASIFTGVNPRSHLAISHESPVGQDITTLAEILKDRGYETGAFISSHALDSEYGLDQGFDTYWEVHKAHTIREREICKQRETDATTAAALAWLKEYADKGFFLWIHWFHPHRPYDPPDRYISAFAGGYSGTADSSPEFIMQVWRRQIEIEQADIDHLVGRYDGEVAFTDVQVGVIIDALETLGLLDNTIVVITADHGEILYDHEHYFGHDIALYDECLRIPLIIHAPGLEIGESRIEQLVQSIDIMPTVLDLLDVVHPEGLEGKCLLPLIGGGGQATAEYCFSETFPFPEKCPPRHAVRTADAKLIWKEVRSDSMVKELYDLAADPGETNNLYGEHPDFAAYLDSVLTAWIAPGGLHPADIPSARDSGRWRILRSLGYVD
jgi:arylsulfatase A-like enzyme